MVQCADSLVWELIKGNNSFVKKTNGRTKRSGSKSFSVEKGNLRSLHRFQSSGLANSKAVDIIMDDNNTAGLFRKTASKAATYPAKASQVTPINKDFRRVENVVRTQTIDNYYRPDLEKAALAKMTKVYQANRRAKDIVKTVPIKKGRGKN